MAEEKIGVLEHGGSRERIERLETAGVPLFPIAFEPGASAGAAVEVIESLSGVDWLAFADLRAADILVSDLEERGIEPFALDEVSIYASGEAVSDRLRFAQVHSDLVPRRLGETLELEEIETYCGRENLAGTVFRVVHTGGECRFPVSGLREAGASVTVMRLDSEASHKAGAKELALLKGGAFDRFHFFSPYDVYDLAYLLAPQEMSDILKSAVVSASDAASARSLAERGIIARVSELKT